LAAGLSARIFVGERVMLSVVTIEPHAHGNVHNHSEEQWGYLLEGSGSRIQDGVAHQVTAGDFWRTPGGGLSRVYCRTLRSEDPGYLQPAQGGISKTRSGLPIASHLYRPAVVAGEGVCHSSRSQSRKSGCAISINASSRALSGKCRIRRAPYSVTT
jgi:hypothetical protein